MAAPEEAVEGGVDVVGAPPVEAVEGGAELVGATPPDVVVGAVTEGEAPLADVDSRPDDAPGPKPREPARAITVMTAAPPNASTRCGAGPELGRGGSGGNTFAILGAPDGASRHLATPVHSVSSACDRQVR